MIQKTFLHDLIAEGLHLPKASVMWANQNAPKPKRSFATIRLFGLRAIAGEYIRPPNEYDVTQIVTPTEAVLEVQYFQERGLCDFACEKVYSLVNFITRPDIVERCAAVGIAIFRAEDVQDLTGLLNDSVTFEQRAAVDFRLRWMQLSEAVPPDVMGVISGVEIAGDDDHSGKYTVKI